MARNHHSRNQWPDERTEQFRVLWGEPPDFLWNGVQLSCAEIGRRMGLSVSAVTGKRNRLALPTRGSPLHAAGSGARPHQYQRVRVPAGADTSTAKKPEPTQPRGSCQFIAGDVRCRGWRFCDAPVAKPGSSWCAKHKRLVFGLRPSVLRAEVG